ncbi:MAG: hypothetical protein ACYSSO_10225 [Planctomycetota bacterium]
MRIMFEDLTFEAQKRLLAEVGIESPSEIGWDILPVAVVDFNKDAHDRHENHFVGDPYDY